MPRHVFLTTEGFPPTVFASQVADLLAVLDRELGLRFEVIDFDPLYARTQATAAGRRRVAELRSALPGPLTVLPYVPYEDRIGQPLARRLLRRVLGRDEVLVHARGLWAADLAARLGVPFVYDVRGDYVAERAMHHGGRGDARGARIAVGGWRLERAEARVCRGAARVLCVSRALRDVLEGRYGDVSAKAHVIPSGHDPQKFRLDPALRRAWRRRLGLEHAFVLAYAGSLVPYQVPEAVAQAGALARRLREDAHLLWLTPEPERARALAHRAGLRAGQVTCTRLPHEDMPGALSAADAALLLRRRDPVNAVASPTKGAEYLACGLPLLISEGVGDLSELVRSERLGAVVTGMPGDAPAVEVGLRALFAAAPTREHVAGVARERLARDRFTDVYRDLYAGFGRGGA